MALRTVEKAKEEIKEVLMDGNVTTIILLGKQGVGKTWMARKISDIVKGFSYGVLWVNLNRKFDKRILYEKIAQQLFLLSTTEEWEDDDKEEKKETLETLNQRITAKLKEKASQRREELGPSRHENNNFFLAILDDVPLQLNEEEIMSELNTLLCANENYFFKVLITRREIDNPLATEGLKKKSDQNGKTRVHQLAPLSEQESVILFEDRIEDRIKKTISGSGFKQLSQAVVQMSSGIPASIVTIAGALEYIEKQEPGIVSLENAEEEEAAVHLTHLLHYWGDIPNKLRGSIVVDCFWHSMQFFRRHGGVHYNELITHWILEGHVGNGDQIQKAYEEGHNVLMELIERGMLKTEEDEVVFMEGSLLRISDQRRSGFNQTASLGLANVFEDEEWKGFGRIIQTDGMIKSVCRRKNWKKVSTLLIDGNRLCWEDAKTFFQPLQGVQTLAILNPRLRSLPLSHMNKLFALVLRGCDPLENIEDISKLTKLCVLEISSAISLTSIPNELFSCMHDLRSINLSSSNIKLLPTSLFSRSKLRHLILRSCSLLEELPSLEALENLEVIDLSGSISLKKIQDQSFSSLKKLQKVNLSGSQIDTLPLLHNLGDLTQILLSGCSYLTALPSLETVYRLQILDLSGARRLEKLEEQSFKNKDELKILDLSGTAIRKLPSRISDLSKLYLRDCSFLLKLPCTREIRKLVELDLSGAVELVEIEDESFHHLKNLQTLNFSKSKIKKLPSLLGLKRLQMLNLSDCVNLVELPCLNALEKLEVLDLSGCSSLKVIEDKSFENLSQLRRLNLSETQIEFLPALCNSSNLSHLLLRSCISLKKLSPMEHLSKLVELNLSGASSLCEIEAQFLEGMNHLQILNLSGTPLTEFPSFLKGVQQDHYALEKLEILDISGTAVGYLPILAFTNLRQLLLKDCSHIEDLQGLGLLSHLEVLDLSGTRITKFPYEISELSYLKRLGLPDLKEMEAVDWGNIKHLPEEVNWDQCGTMKLDDMFGESNKISMSLTGTSFFQYLEKNPKLLETVLKQFHFFVGPLKKQGEDGIINFFQDEPFFRNIYSPMRHIPENIDRFLEIHGSYCLPNGFETVLKHAQYISLIDNNCISCLSDLGAENMPAMRGCWIEKCTKVESILCEDEETDIAVGRNLELLWISNLPNLKILCSGNLRTTGFKNLKHLFLDCCPMIVNVFSSSSQLPENLELLNVKFCDRLETLFLCETEAESCTLDKLNTLQLFGLPEFRSIGMQFPPHQVRLELEGCPKFERK